MTQGETAIDRALAEWKNREQKHLAQHGDGLYTRQHMKERLAAYKKIYAENRKTTDPENKKDLRKVKDQINVMRKKLYTRRQRFFNWMGRGIGKVMGFLLRPVVVLAGLILAKASKPVREWVNTVFEKKRPKTETTDQDLATEIQQNKKKEDKPEATQDKTLEVLRKPAPRNRLLQLNRKGRGMGSGKK